MNYNQLMQKPGKMIEPKVYYFIDGEKHEILHDDIKLAKPFFNAKLIGTVMKGLELELNVKLPDVEVFFENTVSYLDNKDSKIYGPYYLKEEPTYNADSKTYSHTLYDKFIKSMVEYIPIKIEYPTTVYNFFKKVITAVINSISARLVFSPKISKSHCINSRNLPF